MSPDKIKSKGIKSVRSRVTNISSHLNTPITPEVFIQRFAEYMTKNTPDCQYYDIRQHEAEIRRLRDEKYATWEWNFGYSPKYELSRRKRFSAGSVEVHMNIAGESEIKEIKIFGDFFSKKPISELEQRLEGVHHEAEAIESVLRDVNITDYIQGITTKEFISILFCAIILSSIRTVPSPSKMLGKHSVNPFRFVIRAITGGSLFTSKPWLTSPQISAI